MILLHYDSKVNFNLTHTQIAYCIRQLLSCNKIERT